MRRLGLLAGALVILSVVAGCSNTKDIPQDEDLSASLSPVAVFYDPDISLLTPHWFVQEAKVVVNLYGSSSCPPYVESARFEEGVLMLEPGAFKDSVMCTADYGGPVSWLIDIDTTPDEVTYDGEHIPHVSTVLPEDAG